jgi:hypothetical protein
MADARRLNERLVLFDADKRGLAVNFRFSLRRRSFDIVFTPPRILTAHLLDESVFFVG